MWTLFTGMVIGAFIVLMIGKIRTYILTNKSQEYQEKKKQEELRKIKEAALKKEHDELFN